MDHSSGTLTRVVLWCQPRSRSTVFELAMASVPSFQVFHEPYMVADVFGVERQPLLSDPPVPGHAFAEVKARLEADYPTKSVVFTKDFAINIRGNMENLPSGFTHTFLIRDQKAVVTSDFMKTVDVYKDITSMDSIVKSVAEYCDLKAMFEIYKYVKEVLRQRPIVIESDDLVRAPREVLQKYCNETGLPFHESMLKWKPGNKSYWFPPLQERPFVKYYDVALASSSFASVEERSNTSVYSDVELPEILYKVIESNRPIYDQLSKNKIQI
ncbi:uncharacterized protein LOC144443076 [Glandiceps talaboti]